MDKWWRDIGIFARQLATLSDQRISPNFQERELRIINEMRLRIDGIMTNYNQIQSDLSTRIDSTRNDDETWKFDVTHEK